VEAFYRGLIDPLLRASSLLNLQVTRDGGSVTLSWPTGDPTYYLEATGDPAGTTWNEINITPATAKNQYIVTLPADGPAQFFRLRKP